MATMSLSGEQPCRMIDSPVASARPPRLGEPGCHRLSGLLHLQGLALGCAGALAVLLALPGCADRAGLPVRFIVPDGFRGRIQLSEAKEGQEIGVDHGDYLYRIPQGGILKVRKIAGLEHWHKTYAYFLSGQELPVRFTTDPEGTLGEVAFYELSGSRFFVGTRTEMLEYVRNPPPESEAAAFWSGRSLTNPPEPAGTRKGVRQ